MMDTLGTFGEMNGNQCGEEDATAKEKGEPDMSSAMAALRRACSALREGMSKNVSKAAVDVSAIATGVASVPSSFSIDGFVEPLGHLDSVELYHACDMDDVESPWQRYVERVRSRFTAIARLGPRL